jgi:hypothetical protein
MPSKDIRERFPSMTEIVEATIERYLSQFHVAMPVEITEDSDGHTVSLQPLIKRTVAKPDGTFETIDYPVIPDAPVQFPSGNGVTSTHALKKKDQGVYLVASRSIDGWFQQDGEQNQVDSRVHDLSDGFFIPGIRATPRKLENYSKDSTQVRTDDAKSVVDVGHGGVTAKRSTSVVALDDNKVATTKDGSAHVVDARKISSDAGKVLLNCA